MIYDSNWHHVCLSFPGPIARQVAGLLSSASAVDSERDSTRQHGQEYQQNHQLVSENSWRASRVSPTIWWSTGGFINCNLIAARPTREHVASHNLELEKRSIKLCTQVTLLISRNLCMTATVKSWLAELRLAKRRANILKQFHKVWGRFASCKSQW